MSGAWIEAIVHPLGWTLVHFIWQGLLVGIVFGLAMTTLRDASAGSRYALGVATLATLALFPPATFIALTSSAGGSSAAFAAPIEQWVVAVGSQTGPLSSPGWLLWIVALWSAGVAVMTARLWLGWRYLVRLRRSADTLGAASLRPTVDRLSAGMGIARRVQIALSRKVASPVVIGWLKPLILLPPALVNRLPVEQIDMVLAHELAHIRRHDHLINLFQTVVETLLFYHPVVAWVSRRIRVERENACDDLVVRSTGNRLAYVEMLASLERSRLKGARLVLAANDGQILGRIRRLVERTQPRRQRGLVIPALLLSISLAAGIGFGLLPDERVIQAEPVLTLPAEEAARPIDDPVSTRDQTPALTPVPQPGVPAPGDTGPSIELPDRNSTDSLSSPTEAPKGNAAQSLAAADTAVDEDESGTTESTPSGVRPEQAQDRAPAVSTTATDPIENAADRVRDTVQSSRPAIRPAITEADIEPGLQLAALPRDPSRSLFEAQPDSVALEPPPITGGELIRRVEPVYPGRAHRRLTDGQVELEFVVDREGRVGDINILQESPQRWRFGKAAAAAVAEWRFEPFRRGSTPIERTVRVEIVFEPDRSTCPSRTGTWIPNC